MRIRGPNRMRTTAPSASAICFVLDAPVATDVFPICQIPAGINITGVTATTIGGTFTFQIERRAAAGLDSSGTNVLSSAMTASTTGAGIGTGGISLASINLGDFLVLVGNSVTGTPTKLVIRIDFLLS